MRRTDERTQQEKRRATSTGFLILSWGLMGILLYRVYGLGQSFDQLGDIFILWLAANGWVALSSTLRGVQPFDGTRGRQWLIPLVMAGTITATMALVGNLDSIWNGLIAFGLSFVVTYALFSVLQGLYRWWEHQNLR